MLMKIYYNTKSEFLKTFKSEVLLYYPYTLGCSTRRNAETSLTKYMNCAIIKDVKIKK